MDSPPPTFFPQLIPAPTQPDRSLHVSAGNHGVMEPDRPAVLSVQGLYYPAAGGGAQSIHTLLCGLTARGYRCTALTGEDRGKPATEFIDGIRVRRCGLASLEAALTDEIGSLRPLAVFTQQAWSERVVVLCHSLRVPSVCFVTNTGDAAGAAVAGPRRATIVVANSLYMAAVIREKWEMNVDVIPPPIDFRKYQVRPAGDLITMINPVKVKGGAVFRDIARALPGRSFLAVKGWDGLRRPDGRGWDLRKLAEFGAGLPVGVDLSELANVDQQEPVTDMRTIYSRTRILLVPSLWDEAFGRVAVEAMCSGIPVIASARGNLPDTVGSGGILIEDPLDIASWKTAIVSLDDRSVYRRYSRQARDSAMRFRAETVTAAVVRLLDRIAAAAT
jgi:glycosyltransferase involved in cell wall biosynthesis